MSTPAAPMRIARVIIDLALDKTFDYHIPPALADEVKIGVQVNVPFGKGFRKGYVLSLAECSDYPEPLKSIASTCAVQSRLPHSLVELGEWMADYYCCSREQSVRTLLPRVVRSGKVTHKFLDIFALTDTAAAEKFLIDHADKKSARSQCEVLKVLLTSQEITREQLVKEHKLSAASLATLVKKGLVGEDKRRVTRDPFENIDIIPDRPHTPTPEQQAALETLYEMLENPEPGRHTALLYGITGSGKTEVYLQAIARVIEQGGEAIVLVPEIALTPQTVRRFRARFGDMVCVLHSRLTEGERFDEWSKVHDGSVKIAVGARSALFAPFRHLRLIIVDEEHEQSYKQGETPRYHARDVAVMRGYLEKAVVLLGSATPSFESFANAKSGKYRLLELKNRTDNCVLPVMKVIDMRLDTKKDENIKTGLFTKMLVEAISDRLWRGEQTIIFLNRRGYARQMMCENCGYVAQCPDCSVPYTYHLSRQTLTCHLCGNAIQAHEKCPECQSAEIRYSGIGTEKVETVARKLFSSARIARMDSDTMKTHASYEHVLNEFRRGNLDILIGTQMIAKGLHFPNVTLVGIINADQSLFIPDFRAPERTFQLITQVAGRAGRGDIKGEVLIQSLNPFNETIQYAVNHDFAGFYEYDMEVRRLLKYPPAGHLIVIHFLGEDNEEVAAYAEKFMEYLRPACHDGITICEPGPAPIERIKAKFRYQIVLRGERIRQLRQYIRHYLLQAKHPKNVTVNVDVDAQTLM